MTQQYSAHSTPWAWPLGALVLALGLGLSATLAQAGPQAVNLGTSVKGRPITAYVLGSGAKTVAIIGGMHGNEGAGRDVVQSLKHYLETHPEQLVGNRVVLLPAANPDGLAAGTRVNAHKVDINRNFDSGDWRPHAAKDKYNPGPKAGSEPETQALMKLMADFDPETVVNLHAPLHMLNPTGSGLAVAQAMAKHNHYRVDTSVGYPTPGAFGTYCGTKLGRNMVTLELSDAGGGTGWEENREALLAAIAYPGALPDKAPRETPATPAAHAVSPPAVGKPVVGLPSAPLAGAVTSADALTPVGVANPFPPRPRRVFHWVWFLVGLVFLGVGSWLGVRALAHHSGSNHTGTR